MSRYIPHGQDDFFEQDARPIDRRALETPLLRIGKAIRWELFDPILHAAVKPNAKGPGGRPRFHPMLMFKILVLQRVDGVPDDRLSFHIADRDSYRAFLGLTRLDLIPDGQTLADFRDALTKAGALDSLFDAFLKHLQADHGLALAKQGTMLDASFSEVPRQRNSREENAQIKQGQIPQRFVDNPDVGAHKDVDARWTKKNNQSYYGYKNHVKVDVADKLILKTVVTSAEVHDSQVVDRLVDVGDKIVYADSAYQGAPVQETLAGKEIEPQICEKGQRGHPLTEEQKLNNRKKSKTRARVEHVFGLMVGSMNALFQRCIGFERNEACLKLTNLVYNLLRFEQIRRLGLAVRA